MKKIPTNQNASSNCLLEPQNAERSQRELPVRLGDFRLIREIGRGGMGVVYEAEQESLGRRVAIKVLSTSAHDQRGNDRFETEARASAMLHHTNIVPVFGVGHEDDLSFIVMQYINGQPLDRVLCKIAHICSTSEAPLQYDQDSIVSQQIANSVLGQTRTEETANETGTNGEAVSNSKPTTDPAPTWVQTSILSPEELDEQVNFNFDALMRLSSDRFELKTDRYYRNIAHIGGSVADALEYAHGCGLLHRDIKPGNILLDDKNAVWITDFGVATYFNSTSDDQELSQSPANNEVVGTLPYMSPEQLAGKATLSSDIFALGLTLHEMLTLQPAYCHQDKKQLRHQVAKANLNTPRSIDSNIPKDLDAIVMKCVQRDPANRYASAGELAEDLNRFLNGKPVLAREISRTEKVWKWCRRRPTLAATCAALAMSIVLGIVGIGLQWRKTADALIVAESNFETANEATKSANMATVKAEEHFNVARSAVVEITNAISADQLLINPDLLPLRRDLLFKAVAYQKQFVESHQDDADMRRELADGYLQLSRLSRRMRQLEEGLQYAINAKKTLEPLLNQNLSRDERRRVDCSLAQALGEMIATTSLESENNKFLNQALDILHVVQTEEMTSSEKMKIAKLYKVLGDAWNAPNLKKDTTAQDITRRALRNYTDGLQILTSTLKEGGTQPAGHASLLALLHQNIGTTNSKLGNFDEASIHYSASVEQFRKLAEAELGNTEYQFNLANSQRLMGYFYLRNTPNRDTKFGLEALAKSLEGFRKLTTTYPTVSRFHIAESRVAQHRGALLEGEDRLEEAWVARERALLSSEKALNLDPGNPSMRIAHAKTVMGAGVNLFRQERYDAALEFYLRAKREHETVISQFPKVASHRLHHARSIFNIGFVQIALGKYEEAHNTFLEASEDPNPEVMYMTGCAFLKAWQSLQAEEFADNPEAQALAAKCIDSAKEILAKAARLETGIAKRLSRDMKVKKFTQSAKGESFSSWLETYEQQYAPSLR